MTDQKACCATRPRTAEDETLAGVAADERQRFERLDARSARLAGPVSLMSHGQASDARLAELR